jgi:hypothetical protein
MFAPNIAVIRQRDSYQAAYALGFQTTKSDSWVIPLAFSWLNPKDIEAKYAAKYYIGTSVPPTPSEAIPPVFEQYLCGSCWAISVASAVYSRTNIHEDKKITVRSPQELLNCVDTFSQGCLGGDPLEACLYVERWGLMSAKCLPYACKSKDELCLLLNPNQDLGPSQCQAIPCDRAFAQTGSTHYIGTGSTWSHITAIQRDIFSAGPCIGMYFVYLDFLVASVTARSRDFIVGTIGENQTNQQALAEMPDQEFPFEKTNGVYIHGSYNTEQNLSSEQSMGGHAVLVVGWGQRAVQGYDKPINYWICQNSWGKNWGDEGFFRIATTNPEFNINVTIGMDIPLSTPSGRYGGMISFLPRFGQVIAMNENPNELVWSTQQEIFVQKINPGTIALCVFVVLFLVGGIVCMWRSSRSNRPVIWLYMVGWILLLASVGSMTGVLILLTATRESALAKYTRLSKVQSANDSISVLQLAVHQMVRVPNNWLFIKYPNIDELYAFFKVLYATYTTMLRINSEMRYFAGPMYLGTKFEELFGIRMCVDGVTTCLEGMIASKRMYKDDKLRYVKMDWETGVPLEVTFVGKSMIPTERPWFEVGELGGGWTEPYSFLESGQYSVSYTEPYYGRTASMIGVMTIDRSYLSRQFLTLRDFEVVVMNAGNIVILFYTNTDQLDRYLERVQSLEGLTEHVAFAMIHANANVPIESTTADTQVYPPAVILYADGKEFGVLPYEDPIASEIMWTEYMRTVHVAEDSLLAPGDAPENISDPTNTPEGHVRDMHSKQ